MTGCEDKELVELSDELVDLTPTTYEMTRRGAYALALAESCGQMYGEHHKAWVIDQMVRALTGEHYEAFLSRFRKGENGPETYTWDEGVAP